MTGFRHIIGHAGTPVQQSMTRDTEQYANKRTNSLMLGIVLDVYASDDPTNESAQRSSDNRGFMHQCSVLILNDGNGVSYILERVYIPPTGVSGLNDYQEHLPRGTTRTLSGNTYNRSLIGIDPTDLDGEWCVVGYLGSNIDHPIIMNWWPHPKNTYDPLTTGQGNPDASGTPMALNQKGRMFKRINGVEQVITRDGDVYFSTKFAGGATAPENPPNYGRYGRHNNPEVGGSIKVSVKTSQQLEIDFNSYADGVLIDTYDDSLPQTNPRGDNFSTYTPIESTNIRANQTSTHITSPELITFHGGQEAKLTTDGVLTLFSAGDSVHSVGGNDTKGVNGSSTCVTVQKTTHQGLTGLDLVAGFPSSTADPVAPMNVLSTGELTIRSGILIDPARPPSTPAVPADMNVQSTGNMGILVGNEDDGNIPPANLSVKATGEAVFDITDMLNLNGSEVNLGSTTTLDASKYAILLKAFSTDGAFAAQYAALQAVPQPAASPTQAVALVNALNLAFQALVDALKNTATTVTKAK